MSLATFLFGPQWRVTLHEPGCEGVSRIVRARDEFAAKWKVALRFEGDPRVGYLAFKWWSGLQLDEGESVEAIRV